MNGGFFGTAPSVKLRGAKESHLRASFIHGAVSTGGTAPRPTTLPAPRPDGAHGAVGYGPSNRAQCSVRSPCAVRNACPCAVELSVRSPHAFAPSILAPQAREPMAPSSRSRRQRAAHGAMCDCLAPSNLTDGAVHKHPPSKGQQTTLMAATYGGRRMVEDAVISPGYAIAPAVPSPAPPSFPP